MIQAKVICDSINKFGNRLTTLEVVMPRYILAEFNTHRMLSKNSASSRAIPANKMRKSVEENGFFPYAYQIDHTGMQGENYLEAPIDIAMAHDIWLEALYRMSKSHKAINQDGKFVTKQLANRLLEPFMYHKVLVSGTEWENFFELRCPRYYAYVEALGSTEEFFSRKDVLNAVHESELDKYNNFTILDWLKINKGKADIHMMFLAEAIYDAMDESKPKELKEGEYHLPYGDIFDGLEISRIADKIADGKLTYEECCLQSKIRISTSRCAKLSYQTLGDNPVIDYNKDNQLYTDLILSEPVHASPAEHPSRCMSNWEFYRHSKTYITKTLSERLLYEKENRLCDITECYDEQLNVNSYTVTEYGWCRNMRGFIQHRAEIGV